MNRQDLQSLLSQKVKALLSRERDINRMRRERAELRRWMTVTHEASLKVVQAPDFESGMRVVAELVAGELGFDHAIVRCGSRSCDLPPLTDEGDIERVEKLLAACELGPPNRSVTWEDAPTVRFAACARVEGYADLPPIFLLAIRTSRTIAHHPPPWDELMESFAQVAIRPVHALAATRLQRALTKERDGLRARVEDATEDLRKALVVAEKARAEAEKAARVRTEFLTNMSHEIRTPMTAILGYAEVLLDPKLSEVKRVEHLFTIQRSGEHLLALLDDVLDLARIESGAMTIVRQPCVPINLLAEVVSMLRCRATEKSIALDLEIATPLPSEVRTDATRLRQILINVIGNAIKFTPEGSVRARASYERSGSDGVLIIDVIDSGIGMTEEQIGAVFQPFTQVDASTTRSFGGSGLGLSIAKRLARSLGGDIKVKSEIGKGSVFTVRVGVGLVEGASWHTDHSEVITPKEEVPLSLAGRVLVAEDVLLNRKLFSLLLRRAGVEVSLVCDGLEAVAAVQDAQREGRAFDAVLMDMQMPVMDGYEATARLRALGVLVPIVALTAHSMAGDMEKCLRAGCTAYLAKPVTYDSLVAMLARFLGPAEPSLVQAS